MGAEDSESPVSHPPLEIALEQFEDELWITPPFQPIRALSILIKTTCAES